MPNLRIKTLWGKILTLEATLKMMTEFDEQESPHTSLALAGAAFALSFIARQIALLRWLVYPFQLFVTLVHELSHGLAALLTGGSFIRFTIRSDTSGLATTAGGWRWFIIPAGYLGAALFGGVLLVLTNRSKPQGRRWLALGLGLFFALVTLLFARSLLTIVVGGLAAVALLALGRYGPRLWMTFGLNLLAIQCALNALDSLTGLVRLSAGPFRLPNDAQSMADITPLPAVVWAVLWSLIALAILAGSVYLSLRREENA
jgi:hypothetical protein